ncbi:hypothetical protein [Floricoccus penangensis]|uniref:hypothetical protein n=1 Tax=Floricoccus penangensis TaxID=1859475 RepID=UPI00203AD593|nr:hypothetical protein [Floricoccus penangensis]URZ86559.1 hypothetical protein KIW23_05500 [Floricoccus penangensis]
MPIAQNSIFISLAFLVFYIVSIYFISKSLSYGKILTIIFSIISLIFISYYNLKYFGKLNNENLFEMSHLMKFATPILFVPYFLGTDAWIRKGNFKMKPIIVFILEVLLFLSMYYLWSLIMNLIFVGTI